MADQQQPPRRNPVVDALLGFVAALGVLPFEFLAILVTGSLMEGSAITVFWVFILAGVVYFGFWFWLVIANRRTGLLPGLIVGAALWVLLSTACYQLAYM